MHSTKYSRVQSRLSHRDISDIRDLLQYTVLLEGGTRTGRVSKEIARTTLFHIPGIDIYLLLYSIIRAVVRLGT